MTSERSPFFSMGADAGGRLITVLAESMSAEMGARIAARKIAGPTVCPRCTHPLEWFEWPMSIDPVAGFDQDAAHFKASVRCGWVHTDGLGNATWCAVATREEDVRVNARPLGPLSEAQMDELRAAYTWPSGPAPVGVIGMVDGDPELLGEQHDGPFQMVDIPDGGARAVTDEFDLCLCTLSGFASRCAAHGSW